MTEGEVNSADGGRVGELLDGEPGRETSAETTVVVGVLAGGELEEGELAGGAATGVMGGAGFG